MALRAGYYGVKRALKDKLAEIAGAWDETISSIFPRDEQAVLGAKNLLPPNVSKTLTDITFTVDEDGVVTVNGTASAARNYSYCTMVGDGKDYIINCGNPNAAPSPAPLGVYVFDSTGSRQYDVIGTEDKKITFTEGHAFTVYFVVRAGNTVTNEKIYPMLRLATDPDPTYAPPAMTNEQLTKSKFGMYPYLTDSDDLNNIKTSGIYGVTTSPAHSPVSNLQYYILFVKKIDDNQLIQIVHKHDTIYSRRYYYENGALTWSSWYKFEGTVVS